MPVPVSPRRLIPPNAAAERADPHTHQIPTEDHHAGVNHGTQKLDQGLLAEVGSAAGNTASGTQGPGAETSPKLSAAPARALVSRLFKARRVLQVV